MGGRAQGGAGSQYVVYHDTLVDVLHQVTPARLAEVMARAGYM